METTTNQNPAAVAPCEPVTAYGEELASDALGGVESNDGYWRECAAEMAEWFC